MAVLTYIPVKNVSIHRLKAKFSNKVSHTPNEGVKKKIRVNCKVILQYNVQENFQKTV